MEKHLRAKLKSYEEGGQYCIDKATDIGIDKPEITAEIAGLNNDVAEIKADEVIQLTPTTGVTKATTDLKNAMALTTIQYAKKALPLAIGANNDDLVAKLDHEITDISHATSDAAITIATIIKQTLTDNSGVGKPLTNIKPADITAVDTAITNYAASLPGTPLAKEAKKTHGTEAYTPAFARADQRMQNLLNFFTGYFIVDKKWIVDDWEEIMKLKIEGVHHTTLVALFNDTTPVPGEITPLIEGGTMKIVELNLIATSNKFGLAGISQFRPGTYTIEFNAPGFVTKQLIIVIGRGKTVNVQADMVRVAAPPTT